MLPPLLALVEDDASLRELLDMAFQEEGYRTLVLTRAKGAHQAIREAQPAVVILDLWLEEREAGWRLLEVLCRDPVTCHLPILVCSADTPTVQAQAERLRALGCAVIAKPFDLDELLAAVRQALSQCGAATQHGAVASAEAAG